MCEFFGRLLLVFIGSCVSRSVMISCLVGHLLGLQRYFEYIGSCVSRSVMNSCLVGHLLGLQRYFEYVPGASSPGVVGKLWGIWWVNNGTLCTNRIVCSGEYVPMCSSFLARFRYSRIDDKNLYRPSLYHLCPNDIQLQFFSGIAVAEYFLVFQSLCALSNEQSFMSRA